MRRFFYHKNIKGRLTHSGWKGMGLAVFLLFLGAAGLRGQNPASNLPSAGATGTAGPAVPAPAASPAPAAPAVPTLPPQAASAAEEAFFQAIVEGKPAQVASYLSSGGKADAADPGGYTGLMLAISCLRRQIVQQLLQGGANVNHQARDGQTALCLAIEMGSPGMVQDLLKAGADAKGTGRHIPLQTALKLGHSGITRILLSAGADPNNLGTSKIAVSALDQALNIGSAPFAGNLAKAGANLNIQSRTGETALMNATLSSHPLMVKTLLSAGADASLKNAQGQTAGDLAAGSGSSSVKAALQGKTP